MVELEQSENWITLQELCKNNADYFSSYDDETSLRIKEALLVSLNCLKNLPDLYNKISGVAPLFDFDDKTPGNGYRSFIRLIDRCIEHFVGINKQVYERRNGYFFQRSHYMKEIEACSQVLVSLLTCLHHLETLYDWNEGKEQLSLFTEHTPQELLGATKMINQYCFYGRCLGFQFCESIKRILVVITSAMASYSDFYYNEGMVWTKLSNFIKYFTDPEVRAKRLVHISQRAQVDFCQSFWQLNESEMIQFMCSITTPLVKINQVLHIPPEELIVESVNGSLVDVPIPMSHIGVKPIQVRLLSDVMRAGMIGTGNREETLANQSNALIVHCHGGGFVAQSSRSHEIYLKKWTKDLEVPILSIDYSLSPNAPFPRAVEEIVYVYAWVLKFGRAMLGTTLEKIVLVGDSAGANLCVAATLKCLELNLRLPTGIFVAYSPMWVEFISSPSRLLCLTDPLIPFGFLIRCLKAYATVDNNNKTSSVKRLSDVGKSFMEEFDFKVPRDPLLSPYLASDQELSKMPPFKFLSLEFDPCLDDCIMFGKKLKALGVPVTLDIISGLAHGFLNFSGLSKEARDASDFCVKRIKELIYN